jgi:hypothetical protein
MFFTSLSVVFNFAHGVTHFKKKEKEKRQLRRPDRHLEGSV